MQTIIVVLNPGKLENPNADLRYNIPDRISELTSGAIKDNGYDYIDCEEGLPGPLMAIWLEAEDAEKSWPMISKLFREEKFKDNDLSLTAEIYISENETEELENCTLVFPEN